MKTCLCGTDKLCFKDFYHGYEYKYEYYETNGLFRVYNEYGEGYWFNESDMNDWFIKY